MHDVPTIQAVDLDDGTVYVLREPGKEPVFSWWPQPLEERCPDAVRLPGVLGALMERVGIAVSVSIKPPPPEKIREARPGDWMPQHRVNPMRESWRID